MRVYLIGFMGSGKSFFGKKLAQGLNFKFIDLDKMIEEGENKSINSIFETQGEAHFRYLEKKYLAKTMSQINTIIATGGGTPCFFDNIEFINQQGWSIYLESSATLLANRLRPEQAKRPLIKALDAQKLENFIENLLKKRIAFYEQAHIVIHQDQLQPNKMQILISTLTQWIKNQ